MTQTGAETMTDDFPNLRKYMRDRREKEQTVIDHKAEAEEILVHSATLNDPNTLALAHATMYLAEQQRIANLIALAEHAYPRWGNHAGEAGGMGVLFSNPETESGNIRIREDFRKGLGL
jgi:hypothetical protein